MTVGWGSPSRAGGHHATIIEATSTDKAFVINKILPYLFLAALGAWTAFYGLRAKRRGEARRGEARAGLGVTDTHGDARQNSALGYP